MDDDANSAGEPRRSARIGVTADVTLRRTGQKSYRVSVLDLSPDGCKADFIERPAIGELVWLKFEHLVALEAKVCWVRDFEVGLEFKNRIHPAVFEVLVSRLAT